jgi:hypothetical protein
MAKTLTADQLITTITRRAMIPEGQETFTSAELLDIANEEFAIHVLPVILQMHEEYYMSTERQTYVAGTSNYKIPYRAVGNKLRDVQFIDTSGNHYEMTRISIEDLPHYTDNYYSNNYLYKFYVKHDEIILVGEYPSNGELELSYFMQPNHLVENKYGATITSIDTTSVSGKTTLVMSAFPNDFSGTTEIDIIDKRSPNKIKYVDVTVDSTNSALKTVTFTTEDAPTLQVGDYVCKAEETIIPQLPSSLIPVLAQRVAIKCLEALGDTESLQNAKQDLSKMEKNMFSLMDDRVDGAPQKIVNRHGFLGRNSRRRF